MVPLPRNTPFRRIRFRSDWTRIHVVFEGNSCITRTRTSKSNPRVRSYSQYMLSIDPIRRDEMRNAFQTHYPLVFDFMTLGLRPNSQHSLLNRPKFVSTSERFALSHFRSRWEDPKGVHWLCETIICPGCRAMTSATTIVPPVTKDRG